MPVGRVCRWTVLVQTEVELGAVLDDGLIQRTEQDVVVLPQLRQGHHQLSVILTGIAIHQRRRVIDARTIRANHLFPERPLQIGQYRLVKIQITHI